MSTPTTLRCEPRWSTPASSSGRPMKSTSANTIETATVARRVLALSSASSPSCTFADHCRARIPSASISYRPATPRRNGFAQIGLVLTRELSISEVTVMLPSGRRAATA